MIKKRIYIILGILFSGLAFIGIFLPLLPTTPFVLLAAFFFERGSPEFHQKLLDNKYLGPPLKDWQKHKRIRRKNKIIATGLVLLSSYFPLSNPNIPLLGKMIIGSILLAVLIFILSRKEN